MSLYHLRLLSWMNIRPKFDFVRSAVSKAETVISGCPLASPPRERVQCARPLEHTLQSHCFAVASPSSVFCGTPDISAKKPGFFKCSVGHDTLNVHLLWAGHPGHGCEEEKGAVRAGVVKAGAGSYSHCRPAVRRAEGWVSPGATFGTRRSSLSTCWESHLAISSLCCPQQG